VGVAVLLWEAAAQVVTNRQSLHLRGSESAYAMGVAAAPVDAVN
jgi:hypothetical protein